MELILSDPFQFLDTFLLTFVRMLSFISVVPIFSIRNVPMITRVIFAFFLAAIVVNIYPSTLSIVSDQFMSFLLLIVKEFIVGVLLGFGAYLVFSIVTLAGQLIDFQIGFTMVNVFDPLSQIQLTITGNLYYYLFILIMITTNLHFFLIRAIVESYKFIPLGQAFVQPELYTSFLGFFTTYFVLAVKIALPILGVMFLSNVVLGIMARTAPQMNMFVIGMPLKIFVGLTILLLMLNIFSTISHALYDYLVQFMDSLIKGLMP